MTSHGKAARVAGLLYLLASIPGFFGLLYVPSRLVVPGDPSATARNAAASETLFRAGIVADLVGTVGFILVAMALHRLLEGVNRRMAALMVILIVVSTPISFAGELDHLAILRLLHGTRFAEAQRDAQISMLLGRFDDGILVVEIFWGLWLFPLGLLIIRSGFLPRVLGVLLFLAGLAWVTESFTGLLLPQYSRAVGIFTSQLRTLELPTPLWLLIMGAREPG